MKIDSVIFDWAGTTVDFGCFAPLNVFIDIFKEKSISITVEEARAPMGMLKKDHIREILKGERVSGLWEDVQGRKWEEKDVEEMFKNFEPQLMKNLKNYTSPKSGLFETINFLKNKNIKIGSSTGYTEEMMKIVSAESTKNGYTPDAVVTSDMVANGRPYPYMCYKNAELLNIKSLSNSIKVGDTEVDILEGKNAGMISVGVIDGSSVMGLSEEEFNSISSEQLDKIRAKVEETFIKAGADYVIKDLSELPKLIEQLGEKNER
ncbi:MAG: phosphonoacetaldehyde hydrolase [Spirochaetales bacterium]|nr:phosphonoacetaldehyde hydrolase [Spirochaetales bacterium]